MKKIAGCMLIGLVGPLMLVAQSPTTPAASQGGTVSIQQLGAQGQTGTKAQEPASATNSDSTAANRVQPGSIIYAQIDKSVDAKKVRVGDPVVAKLEQPLLSKGKIIAPRGAKVIGHVTTVQARSKDHPRSELGISFDRIVLKDGSQIPSLLAIQAIGAAPMAAPLTSNSDASASNPTVGPGMPGRTGSPGMLGNSPSPATDAAGNSTGINDVPGAATIRPDTSSHVSASSHGVVGISDVEMAKGSSDRGVLLTSDKKNVKLESGNELVLRAQ